MTRIAAFLVLIILLALHAAWRGGAPERLAAAAMLSATVATSLTNLQVALPFREVQWPLVWIDAVLFVAALVGAIVALPVAVVLAPTASSAEDNDDPAAMAARVPVR